jgi:predicted dehydrogenase
MKTTNQPPISSIARRDFLKKSLFGAGLVAVPSFVVGQSPTQLSPANRINIAIVGAAGRGRSHVISAAAENVVALCDVDRGFVQRQRSENRDNARAYNEALTEIEKKGARWFTDYREMFAEMADQIDAVVVATPDHMHFPIAMSAIQLGKHVYCEKPLTHTVEEARLLREAAAKARVVTQMGNQGHSNNGTRMIKEWIEAGVIGDVHEVHSWTNRPAAYWPQGMPAPDHSSGAPAIPEDLDWDLWLGVAAARAYDPAYVPFKWRGYFDFGCGALGDMGCHIMDAAYWALNLGVPSAIEAATTEINEVSYPKQSHVVYNFPKRRGMPALEYHWYSGDIYPPLPSWMTDYNPFRGNVMRNGTLIVGDGMAILTDTYSESARILPREKFIEVRPSLPSPSIPRIKGTHFQDWTNAIRNGGQACSNFEYSGPMTETVLLGAAAIRAGRKLAFDADTGLFVGDPEANGFLSKPYEEGWILG